MDALIKLILLNSEKIKKKKKPYLDIVKCHNVFMLQLLSKNREEKQDALAQALSRLQQLMGLLPLIFLSGKSRLLSVNSHEVNLKSFLSKQRR